MAAQNWYQKWQTNPITTNQSGDLLYFARSPYGSTNDAVIDWDSFIAQFAAPYTASALTKTNDTNVTLTLGGTPATSLLQAVSLTLGWTGQLALSRGGSGANLTAAAGGIVYSGASAMAITSAGTSGQLFQSAGTSAPGWTTNTYPSTDSKGDILYASAANTIGGLAVGSTGNILTVAAGLPAWTTATYPATTTINQLLFSSSNNVVGGITAGNYGVLISSSSGVPSWLANGTTGQVLTATTSGTPSWGNAAASSVTFTGDSGTPFSGAAVTVTGASTGLTFVAGTPNLTLSGVLGLTNGGTNHALTASAGGMVWSDSTKLNILSGTATAGQLLLSGNAATPSWSTSTYPATNAANTLLYASSANTMAALTAGANGVLVSSNSNVPSWLANGTAGYALVAQSGAPPAWAAVGAAYTPAALTKTDDTNVTMTLGGTPSTALLQATSMTLGWTGQLSVARGGTGSASVVSAPAATAWAGWDANKNLSANSLIEGYATTATAASTTTLVVGSAQQQYFTGSTTQTVLLPVTSTLVLGQQFYIVNNSSGVVTVQSSGANAIQAMAANTYAVFTCILTSGTTAASWNVSYSLTTGAYLPLAGGTMTGNIAMGSNTISFSNGAGLKDNNGNAMALFNVVASAVNYLQFTNNTTGNPPVINAVGSDSNIGLNLGGKGTGAVNILGASTNSSASSGYVGEFITSNIASGSAVTATSNAASDVTSIALTAGDWDVWGNVVWTALGSAPTNLFAWCSTSSATLPDASLRAGLNNTTGVPGANTGLVTPMIRVSASGNQTVYLSGQLGNTSGNGTACGTISARRRR